MKEKLQKIGSVMLIPISVITIGSMFMGFGSAFTSEGTIRALGLTNVIYPGSFLYNFFTLMNATGDLVFSNLPIFFAIGVSFGLAKKEKGWAAFSAAIGFIAMHTIISQMFSINGITPETIAVENLIEQGMSSIDAVRNNSIYHTELGIFTYRLGIFGGLIIAVLTSLIHNKLYNVKLPMVLEFFAGTRTVPVVTLTLGAVTGFIMYYIWPPIGLALTSLGVFINETGLFGTFIWAALDKGLLPFGLHHLLTTPIRLTELGGTMNIGGEIYQGTTNIYMAQIASNEPLKFLVRGFQSGRVTLHFGALPGAALAMYKTAKPGKKKAVAGMLIPVVLTMILFGVTEPIEFTFLFVAPWLFYLVHVPLTGLAFVLTEAFNVSIYGGSIKDILPVLFQPDKLYLTPYLWLIPLFFILYYFIFKYLIEKFNLATPGREDDEDVALYTKEDYRNKKEKNDHELTDGVKSQEDREPIEDDITIINDDSIDLSTRIVTALGGVDNIEHVGNCMTRLRVQVKDVDLVVNDNIWTSKLEANGVVHQGKSLQIVYGTKVSMIAADITDKYDLG